MPLITKLSAAGSLVRTLLPIEYKLVKNICTLTGRVCDKYIPLAHHEPETREYWSDVIAKLITTATGGCITALFLIPKLEEFGELLIDVPLALSTLETAILLSHTLKLDDTIAKILGETSSEGLDHH